MNIFLTPALILCSIIIIILGVSLIVQGKLNPKVVGITLLLIVCDLYLVFSILYSKINTIYKVLGIDS